MVVGPAIGLIVVGLLDLLPLLFVPISRVTMSPAPIMATTLPMTQGSVLLAQMAEPSFPFSADISMLVLLLPLLVGLPLAGLLIIGGLKMKKLELYGLAVIVSVVAILPCHLGFIFGLPVGLWSLAVLSRADVKAAFR